MKAPFKFHGAQVRAFQNVPEDLGKIFSVLPPSHHIPDCSCAFEFEIANSEFRAFLERNDNFPNPAKAPSGGDLPRAKMGKNEAIP